MAEDEELLPTLENMVVLTWLNLIHPSLPRLDKQWYGMELRSRTLASVKPEISQALTSLLDEICASDDAKSFRTAITVVLRHPAPSRRTSGRAPQSSGSKRPCHNKVCPLCQQAGRLETHCNGWQV